MRCTQETEFFLSRTRLGVDFGRLGTLPGAPGYPFWRPGSSLATLRALREAPETLRRRPRDALASHRVSREGPGSDFESILGAPGRLRRLIFSRFSQCFLIDFSSELASKRDDSRRLGALTDIRCEAKKPDGERAINIAGRSSLLDEASARARNRHYDT